MNESLNPPPCKRLLAIYGINRDTERAQFYRWFDFFFLSYHLK